MDITIIVPVYNRAHLVGATLDSIAAQTLRPIHLVLVDNNSQDNTLKVLLDFKKRHQSDDFKVTVLQETRRGAAAARNCGLQEATTEWVVFFDSDDIMARIVEHPTCTNAFIEDNVVHIDISLEILAEIIGETKMQVTVFQSDEIVEEEEDFENEINENFLNG